MNLISIGRKLKSLIYNHRQDIIVPIGDGCVTAQALKDLGSRKCAYPFDWCGMSDLSLLDIINIICNNFENFFEKKLLELSYQAPDVGLVAYRNKRTSIIFNHDFLYNGDFECEYKKAKEKYDRRCIRLLADLECASNISLVCCEVLKLDKISDLSDLVDLKSILQESIKLLNKSFPEKFFRIIYIRHNEIGRDSVKYSCVTRHFEIIDVNNNYIHRHYSWKGNYEMIMSILKKLKLRQMQKIG